MEVNLSSGVRETLGSLKRVSELQDRTSERLSKGKKVNSYKDDAISFAIAQSLTSRASDYNAVKDNIGQAVSKVDTTVAGLDSISSLLDQAKALSLQRQSTSDATEQAALDAQFTEVAQQITNISRDANYGGTSLISATPDTVNVNVNPEGTSQVTLTGSASDATTLAIDITDPATIDAAQATIRSTAQTIGSQAAVLDIRENFTKELTNNLEAGAAKLVNADLNEEAANTLSLQTRGALAAEALNIAAKSERAILQLF